MLDRWRGLSVACLVATKMTERAETGCSPAEVGALEQCFSVDVDVDAAALTRDERRPSVRWFVRSIDARCSVVDGGRGRRVVIERGKVPPSSACSLPATAATLQRAASIILLRGLGGVSEGVMQQRSWQGPSQGLGV